MNKKECIHKIKSPNLDVNKISFIILCGGKSGIRGVQNTSLMTLSDGCAVLDHQLRVISNQYQNYDYEIILVSGFESKKILDHILEKQYSNIRFLENKNYLEDSCMEAWKIGINCCLDSDVCVIHGDRIFNAEAITPLFTSFLTTSIIGENKHNYNIGINYQKNRLIHMSYGLTNVWSEITFIPRHYIRTMKDTINNTRTKKIYTIDKLMNYLSRYTEVYIDDRKDISVTPLKELI